MCDPRLHPVGPQEGEEYCPQVGSGSSYGMELYYDDIRHVERVNPIGEELLFNLPDNWTIVFYTAK